MTLLEVVVAMAIVAIGVLTVLQSQASTHRLLSRVQSHERLAVFAEGIMEKLISERKIPSTGRSTGAFKSPNEDISWNAQIKRKSESADWDDTSSIVRIDLTVVSRDGAMALATERYWP